MVRETITLTIGDVTKTVDLMAETVEDLAFLKRLAEAPDAAPIDISDTAEPAPPMQHEAAVAVSTGETVRRSRAVFVGDHGPEIAIFGKPDQPTVRLSVRDYQANIARAAEAAACRLEMYAAQQEVARLIAELARVKREAEEYRGERAAILRRLGANAHQKAFVPATNQESFLQVFDSLLFQYKAGADSEMAQLTAERDSAKAQASTLAKSVGNVADAFTQVARTIAPDYEWSGDPLPDADRLCLMIQNARRQHHLERNWTLSALDDGPAVEITDSFVFKNRLRAGVEKLCETRRKAGYDAGLVDGAALANQGKDHRP